MPHTGMDTREYEGEHRGEAYVVTLVHQDGGWRLNSLVIGMLPREFEGLQDRWPTVEEAEAAARRMAETFIEAPRVQSGTVTHPGWPLGGG